LKICLVTVFDDRPENNEDGESAGVEDQEIGEVCQSCLDKERLLQEANKRHAQQIKERSEWYEKELENPNLMLRKEMDERNQQSAQFKSEITILKRKHHEAEAKVRTLEERNKKLQCDKATGSTIVAQAVAGIVSK
jgi:tRNA G10  N-methylase Trm11